MNKNLLTTTTNSDNTKAVYFNEDELALIYDCLIHCSEQVATSNNDIVVIDQDRFDVRHQYDLINEVVSAVEIPLTNFNDLETYEQLTDRVRMMMEVNDEDFDDSELAIKQETANYTKLVSDYKRQITELTKLQMPIEDCELYTNYQFLIDDLYIRLRDAENDLQQCFNKIMSKEREDTMAVYKQIKKIVDSANDDCDNGTLAEEAYERTMFTISSGDKKVDVKIFADAYNHVLTMLENIYVDCYDGDRQLLE